MKKAITLLFLIAPLLFVSACAGSSLSGEAVSTDNKRTAKVAEKVGHAGFPYVENGGGIDGANTGTSTNTNSDPGFDEAGFVVFVLASAGDMFFGSSPREILSNMSYLKDSPEKVKSEGIQPGYIVTDKDRRLIGIMTKENQVAYASEKEGKVIVTNYDPKVFPDVYYISSDDRKEATNTLKEMKREEKAKREADDNREKFIETPEEK